MTAFASDNKYEDGGFYPDRPGMYSLADEFVRIVTGEVTSFLFQVVRSSFVSLWFRFRFTDDLFLIVMLSAHQISIALQGSFYLNNLSGLRCVF